MKLTIKVNKGRKLGVQKLLNYLDIKWDEYWDLDNDKFCMDVEVSHQDLIPLRDLIKEVNYI